MTHLLESLEPNKMRTFKSHIPVAEYLIVYLSMILLVNNIYYL